MMSRCEADHRQARAIRAAPARSLAPESPTRSTPSAARQTSNTTSPAVRAGELDGEQSVRARFAAGEHDERTQLCSRPGRRAQARTRRRHPAAIRERVDRRVGADATRIALRGERVDQRRTRSAVRLAFVQDRESALRACRLAAPA